MKKQEMLKLIDELGLIDFEKMLIANDYSLKEVKAIFESIKDDINDCHEFGVMKYELNCYMY